MVIYYEGGKKVSMRSDARFCCFAERVGTVIELLLEIFRPSRQYLQF